jgi:hypothetical protein
MGFCYSICASALWPCVAIIVPMKQLGMAYGLQTAFQNGGLAVFPILISALLPDADSQEPPQRLVLWWGQVMGVFAQITVAAIALTIILWCAVRHASPRLRLLSAAAAAQGGCSLALTRPGRGRGPR